MNELTFLPQERRTVQSITTLFALRAIGLFLLYPVLALHASSLEGHTPLLVGLAFGAFGLSQACFQIPYGLLSDRFGRKRMIALGLVIFGLGSLVAAFAESIWGLILGRFFQGAGAISAVCTATLGDVIAPERRARAMAFFGIAIGAGFSISLVVGPTLAESLGVQSIFFGIAGACVIGLCLTLWGIPSLQGYQVKASMGGFRELFSNRIIWVPALSMGFLHMVVTAMFMVIPGQLMALTGQPLSNQATYYLIGIFAVFMTVFPTIRFVQRRRIQKQAFVVAWGMVALSLFVLAIFESYLYVYFAALLSFFVAFNYLEATLPAWMSRIAPSQYRGAAMGVFSTCQFAGAFLGGVLAGSLLQYFSTTILFFVLGLKIITKTTYILRRQSWPAEA